MTLLEHNPVSLLFAASSNSTVAVALILNSLTCGKNTPVQTL